MSSKSAYKFIDRTFDVVVVCAGGAGLRATGGAVEADSTTAQWCFRQTAIPLLADEWAEQIRLTTTAGRLDPDQTCACRLGQYANFAGSQPCWTCSMLIAS
ncbi:hypothetical protein [Bradyrhizobium sp. WSM2254]|uniref:hypothetical protein n=1 Tax=Bradyrhizobium sp. WSM2254 TaxID=1188263 RepID=UPI0012EBF5A0|nr:hypothetical protein [Bradyrhizobium sp. WSM2254]